MKTYRLLLKNTAPNDIMATGIESIGEVNMLIKYIIKKFRQTHPDANLLTEDDFVIQEERTLH